MANTIKLKRGSGSDPSASDLSVGEIAIRTDSGKLFTKKDNGSVAEISGSGGIDDGDKGDITVSNSGGTFTIDNGVVTSAKIADGAISASKLGSAVVSNGTIQDGVINNAKVSASAAIAGTKISPIFGSGGDLTNHIGNRERLAILGSSSNGSMLHIRGGSPAIFFDQSGSNIGKIYQDNVNLAFHAGTPASEGTNTFLLEADGDATFAGNLDVGAGLDVTGDITGTGNLTLTSTNTSSDAAPEFELYRNSSSPADADYLGQLKFTGESDDGSKEVYAKMTGKIDDASSGTEDGLIEFALRKAGSNNIGARLTSTDLKLINGTGLEVAGATTMSGTLTINNASPNLLFTESDANPDFGILLSAGQLKFQDTTNTENILTLDDDKIQAVKNLDALNGIDVTGNAAVSGSVTAPRISGSNGILEVKQEIGTSQTLTSGYNAIAVDPTIANGVTITVPSGAVWSIV